MQICRCQQSSHKVCKYTRMCTNPSRSAESSGKGLFFCLAFMKPCSFLYKKVYRKSKVYMCYSMCVCIYVCTSSSICRLFQMYAILLRYLYPSAEVCKLPKSRRSADVCRDEQTFLEVYTPLQKCANLLRDLFRGLQNSS